MSGKNAKRKKRGGSRAGPAALAALILVLCFVIYKNGTLAKEYAPPPAPPASGTGQGGQKPPTVPPEGAEAPAAETPEQQALPQQEPAETARPLYDFAPYSVDSTAPSNLISGTSVMDGGNWVDSAYTSDLTIDFGFPEDYTELEGVITFRGNNFRNTASYGVADMAEKKLSPDWTVGTGALHDAGGDYWSGNGWTGQPLIVKWPKQTRVNMNMYDWAKEKDELVEVIYASMDGKIYFLELESGSRTRDDLNIGFTFKGAGALDPRGYPILYVGSGVNSSKGTSRAFIISLIDCSIMYEFGAADSFSLRGTLSFFDSSPLVDVETDTLIYPGESGILYLIRLNSWYDEAGGAVGVNPDRVVRWRYNGTRTTGATYWLGMEDSAIIWRGHIIMSDNGGNLMCLDLNTLKLSWVQNVLDDTNCTPVLELEDGHPYLYTSTSFHYGWRSYTTATIPIWKIDAVTGEIVWQVDYSCGSVAGTSGGVQGTLAIGKKGLSDLIFVPVARTPSIGEGILAAINKRTGEVVWEFPTAVYSWSSPVAVYDKAGNGYIIYCTAGGYMYLLDGLTGEKLDGIDLGSNVEASPAAYNNTVVVGTRGQLIYGVTLR